MVRPSVISVIVVLSTLQGVASVCSAPNSLLLTVRNQTPDHTQKLIANCDNFDCDRGILVAQESRLHNMCVLHVLGRLMFTMYHLVCLVMQAIMKDCYLISNWRETLTLLKFIKRPKFVSENIDSTFVWHI